MHGKLKLVVYLSKNPASTLDNHLNVMNNGYYAQIEELKLIRSALSFDVR